MSQESVKVVRKTLPVRHGSGRTLDQRLAVRFPRLASAYLRLVLRLPPRARLRQAVLVRGLALATQAFNRRDLDLAVSSWTPDTEYCPPRQWIDAGFVKPSYRGPDGFREFVSSWSDVWGPDLRMEAVEMIDLGDRIVLLGNLPATTLTSGVPYTGKFATVSEMDGGTTVRVRQYVDHDGALEAVGLRV